MDADENREDGTRDIPDLPQLALEDHAAHSSLYSACAPGPDNSCWPTPDLGSLPPSSRSTSDDDSPLPLPDDGNTQQPTLDGSSPPDSSIYQTRYVVFTSKKVFLHLLALHPTSLILIMPHIIQFSRNSSGWIAIISGVFSATPL